LLEARGRIAARIASTSLAGMVASSRNPSSLSFGPRVCNSTNDAICGYVRNSRVRGIDSMRADRKS
jgi:hypothetical protein